MSNLTPKQEMFCQEYVRTGNKSEAYRLAYDASKMPNESIHVKANEVSNNVKVSLRVDELKNILESKALYTLEESVHRDLKLIKTYEYALEILQNPDAETKEVEAAERTIKFIGANGYSSSQDRLSKQHGFYAPEKSEIVGTVQMQKVKMVIKERKSDV